MIEIIKEPAACSFTKNSMIFEVKSDQFFLTPALYPKIRLTFDQVFTAGLMFQFSFINPETKNQEIVFFRTVAGILAEGDLKGYETSIEVSNAHVYLNQETLAYVEALKKIKILNAYYSVNYISSGTIDIIAKEPFEDLVPKNVVETLNEGFIVTFGTEIYKGFNVQEERIGYQLVAYIYYNNLEVDNLNNWSLITSQNLALDEDAVGLLDVSEIINSKIESEWQEIPLPHIINEIAPTWWFINKNLKTYFVVFKEFWFDEATEFSAESSKLFAHWGGISTDDEIREEAINHTLTFNSFLTWIPSGKTNHPKQLDFLHFINGPVRAYYSVNLKLYTSDQIRTYELAIDNPNPNVLDLKPYESFGFYANLNYYLTNDVATTPISLDPGEVIKKYEFEVYTRNLDDGTFLFTNGAVATYLFHVEETCGKKYVLYFNSFGVCESFSTSGDWIETINISNELASRGLNYNNSILRNQNFIFNTINQNSIKVESSMLLRDTAKKLQAMLASTYTFIEEDNRWLPVIMDAKKIDFWNNSEYIVYLQFEMVKANFNDRVSFFKTLPSIQYQRSEFSDVFKLQLNGFKIESVGDLVFYKDKDDATYGTTYIVKTLTFDSVNLEWNTNVNQETWKDDGLTEGVHFYKTTITDLDGNEHILKGIVDIRWETMVFSINHVGTPYLNIVSNIELTSIIKVNYSDGSDVYVNENINFFYLFGTIGGSINYTYTGWKKITIKAPTFSNIISFSSVNGLSPYTGTDIRISSISKFKNLKKLKLSEVMQESLFLNSLTLLEEVSIFDSPLTKIEIGFQKNLTSITLRTLALETSEIESFIREFWNFRKKYLNAITIVLWDLALVNDETTAMINGTGIYASDGLIHNNFTVTFV